MGNMASEIVTIVTRDLEQNGQPSTIEFCLSKLIGIRG